MSEILIQCENLGKKFCRDLKKSLWYGMQDCVADLLRLKGNQKRQELREGEFWANSGIGFELKRGECLGLIGSNGAGKTTLLKMLSGLIKPDVGKIELRGRVGAMIALGAGFNPVLTGRENVYIAASILGLSISEVKAKYDEIVEFAELDEFMDSPVRTYSSGMQVRLGFSVASSIEPDILIIDEVLAVGDVGFRTKCYNRINQICKDAAVIFVSHSMPQVDRLCSRALLLADGQEAFQGGTGQAIDQYNRLFVTETREWEIGDGVSINSITINGDLENKSLEVTGSDSLEIEIDATFPERTKALEISISFLEKSYELISQANSRFDESNVQNTGNRQTIKIHIPKLNLGSGLKLMSIAVVDADTNEILFWAAGAWECAVTNACFIPSPSYCVSEFSSAEKS